MKYPAQSVSVILLQFLTRFNEGDFTYGSSNDNPGTGVGTSQRMERKTRNRVQNACQLKGGTLARLHSRCGRAVQGDRQRQGSRIPVHHEGEHCSRRVRRKRRARSWQHRTARRDAGHGGEGGALQGVWRRECRPYLPRHTGHRGDHQGSHLARTGLRRHQP